MDKNDLTGCLSEQLNAIGVECHLVVKTGIVMAAISFASTVLLEIGPLFTQHSSVPGSVTRKPDHLLSLPQKAATMNQTSVLGQLCKHHPFLQQ